VSIFLRPNPSSGVPIYLQLKDQIRHAVEVGALRAGDALPPIRSLAVELVVNVNTVARVYRELEQEGVVALRHGIGAFVAEPVRAQRRVAGPTSRVAVAQPAVRKLVRSLIRHGLSTDEIRRLIEAELSDARSVSDDAVVSERSSRSTQTERGSGVS